MVMRRNRTSGEPFFGCTQYPSCRGTRPRAGSAGASPVRRTPERRYRLSLGGRPKGIADYVELLVARRVGRDLTKREGCLVQGVTIVVFLALIYWFVSSGALVTISKLFADWYAHQFTLPGSPTPSAGG